jgi:ubiquilin
MSININIKSSTDKKFVISIEASKKVLELKEAIAAQTDVPADRQRLIFSGRVLKDDDLLSEYKVADGNTIHMVKGAAPNQPKGKRASERDTSGYAGGRYTWQ